MIFKKEFTPNWVTDSPRPGTFRSLFKWGDPKAFKHPNGRLVQMMIDKLGMTKQDFAQPKNTGQKKVDFDFPVNLKPTQIKAFEKIVGKTNVSTDSFTRLKYATGKNSEEALLLRRGKPVKVADVVVHPRNARDVEAVVKYCNRMKIPIYVYGGGSSVTFGLSCEKGGVTLVMNTHMKRMLDFNENNQTITVEAGMMGPDYEDLLNNAPERLDAKRAYTCGHFPQSFEYSSVGGWIVTLGAGQQSSYYGDAYDIVVSQEYVTPVGVIKTLDYPATATGPKVNDILKGSEGAFGVLVSATLKIFRHMPRNRQKFAFVFPSWEKAVEAAREITQSEFGMPSVFRVSDPEETDVALKLYGIEGTPIDKMMDLRGFRPMERCLFIGEADGEKAFCVNIKKKVKEICSDFGAMYISGYPLGKWEHGRYTDPYMREDLNDFGILIDTLETAVTWDNLHKVHKGVRAFVKSHPGTICMTHGSHFYPQGTNLYFIFIARMDDVVKYRKLQRGIIDAIEKHGGSLSHHHGVGKMIAPWMKKHLGKEQMAILKALKNHFDPNNIMNPGGTLGLN